MDRIKDTVCRPESSSKEWGYASPRATDARAGFWYDPAPMTPNRLGAEGGAFTLNGRRMFLYDGELHYFRVRPELWRPGLERLKAAGMNTVSTYLPWVWHEPEEGRFDFAGA